MSKVKKPRVFISYVKEDLKAAKHLARTLGACDLEVWIDRIMLKPGQRWKDVIKEAIATGDYFIACFSKAYNSRTKSYMNEELVIAIEELRQRPTDRAWFIPVRLNECDIPNRSIGAGETLRSIQWVDLYKDWNRGIELILSTINPGLEIIDKSIKRLRSDSARVRIAACDTLAQIGFVARRAVSKLIELLKDNNETVRRAAVGALGRIGVVNNHVVFSILCLIRDKKYGYDVINAQEVLPSFGLPAIEHLLSAFKEDPSFKNIIAEAFAKVKDTNAVRMFLTLTSYDDPIIRSSSARGLGNILGQAMPFYKLAVNRKPTKFPEILAQYQVVSTLIQLLNDDSAKVRSSAVFSLASISTECSSPNKFQLT